MPQELGCSRGKLVASEQVVARHVGGARLKFCDINGSNPVFNIFPKWERRVCNKTVQLLCFGFVIINEMTIGPGQARSGRASGP